MVFLKDPAFIELARILKEWGVKGWMKALPLSDLIFNITPPYEVAVLLSSKKIEKKILSEVKRHQKYIIFSFNDVSDRNTASYYRGALIISEKKKLSPLPTEKYFYDQIIGLSVYTIEGELIGIVESIFETGSNDVYVVKNREKEYLIPAIKDVIKKIDIDNHRIIIKVMEGMFD